MRFLATADALIPTTAAWCWLVVVAGLVVLVLTLWGAAFLGAFAALRVAGTPAARRCEELLYGVLGFSAIGFAGVLSGVRLLWTFAIGSVLLAVTGLVRQRRRARAPAPVPARPAPGPRTGLPAWWAPALVLLGSALWSAANLRGLETVPDGVSLRPWVDFYFHARQIGNFSQFRGDPGSLHWALYGEPIAAYHYGSYIVAALVADLGGLSAMHLATSLFPVLGMVLTGAAMIVLAESSAGPRAAVIGVALLFFVPDVSSFVPGFTRQYSYFFFQQVGVGGAYAVAAMGLALASAAKAIRTRSLLLTAWSGALFLLGALFKIQIVMAFGVFFFACLALTAPGVARALRIAGACIVVAIYALAVARLGRIENAPTLSMSLEGVRQMFHLQAAGGSGILAAVALVPVGALAIFAATYGLLLPLMASLMWRLRGDPAMRPTIVLALGALFAHACVRLLIDDNRGYGDIAEINRKTFVLPYLVVVYATAVLMARLVGDGTAIAPRRRPALLALGLVFAAATAFAAVRLQEWRGTSETFSGVVVPRGLFDVATRIRAVSARGEVVQLCTNDRYNQLASLSERPVYVAKLLVNAAPLSATESERLSKLAAIMSLDSLDSAVALARLMHVSWFVMTPECHARWEEGLVASFSSHRYRLYHLGP
jgi:hypothetical protein